MSIKQNTTSLQELLEAVNNLPEAGSGEQATPEISVDTKGLITATAGEKSATKQLTTQAAKTITPSTSSQTAVASGKYTTGAITVAGDSNLVSGNIKSGVSIFGVSGTYVGSGGSGGLQAVSGTFTPSLNYGVGNNMTISGLPFKPQYIFVSTTSGFTSSSTNHYPLSLFFDDIGNRSVKLTSSKSSSTLKGYTIGVDSSTINIEVTDDGFIVSFTETYYTRGSAYIWYAFR